ncbi:MAG: hypothetical protein KY469_04810 [Actinobacteria bacterium]|nr:hypothetical protein [Actinomycetota bacterium]
MIVCGNCSYENEDDDQFCGSCGSPLAWTGQKVEAPTAAEPEPEPELETEPGDRTVVEKVKDVLTGRESEVQQQAEERARGREDEARRAEEEAKATAEAEAARAAQAEEYAGTQTELAQQRQAEAEAAEKARQEAEAKAQVEAAAAAEARRKADELELARAEALERAEQEALEAAALKRKLEEAEKARFELEERLKTEAEQATKAMAEAQAAAAKATEEATAAAQAENKEQAEAEAARLRQQAEAAEKARQEAESRLALERQAIAEAKAKAEAAEQQRKVAEEKAKRDAEELERARRDAEEAEQARREAEAKAAKEAEEAARTKRAAAMVAKSASQPLAPTTPAETKEPAPTAGTPTAPTTPQATTPQTPQAQKPVAQKPQKIKQQQKKAPPKPKEEERKYDPGDLICGECGEGNSPERKFCRRCGHSLAEAEVAKTPWYKRLFKRKPKAYAAGERRKGGRSSGVKGAVHGGKRAYWGLRRLRGGVFRVLLIMAVVGGAIGVSVGPTGGDVRRWFSDRVDSVKCYFSQPDPQQARVTSFSSETPEHPAQHAFDFGSNTYWQAEGSTATATVDFAGQVLDITHVQFQSGTAEGAVELARPAEVAVTFVTRDDGELDAIILAGLPNISTGPERRAVEGATNVTGATVQIVATHSGLDSEDVAIREVEFLAKNC